MDHKPDFGNAYALANEILVKSEKIRTFPFSVIDLVHEQTSVKCRSYKTAMKYGLDVADFGSDSAVYIKYQGKGLVFYNEEHSLRRIRFSIPHELGHIVNKHDMNVKDERLYGIFEIEANYFAAQLLMPEQIIREFQRRGLRPDAEFLANTFDVSGEAAERRLQTLNKINYNRRSFEEKEYDDVILLKYALFIDAIRPSNYSLDWYEDEYERQKERDLWAI